MLRTIVEDATRYFLFIFTSHIALAMLLSFGRVRLATALLSLPQLLFNACLSRNRSNIFQLQLRKWFLACPQYNHPHYPSSSPRSAEMSCEFYSYLKTHTQLTHHRFQVSSGDDLTVNAFVEESRTPAAEQPDSCWTARGNQEPPEPEVLPSSEKYESCGVRYTA